MSSRRLRLPGFLLIAAALAVAVWFSLRAKGTATEPSRAMNPTEDAAVPAPRVDFAARSTPSMRTAGDANASQAVACRGAVVRGAKEREPASGVRIVLIDPALDERADGGQTVAETVSGSLGQFEFPPVQGRAFRVVCELPEWEGAAAWAPPDGELLLVLTPRWSDSTIVGVVLSADGLPVTDYHVTIGGRGLRHEVLTDVRSPLGSFRVPVQQGRTPAEIGLSINAPGYRRTGLNFRCERGELKDLGEFVVQRYEQVVRGVVVEAGTRNPIAGASIRPVSANLLSSGLELWGHESEVLTDEAGAFEVNTINGEGVVGLEVFAPGFARRTVKWAGVSKGARDVVLELSVGATLQGRVLDARGEPVVGRTVRISSPEYSSEAISFYPLWQEFAETDSDGRISFGALSDGVFEVNLLQRYCSGDGWSASRTTRVTVARQEDVFLDLLSGDGCTLVVPIVDVPSGEGSRSLEGRLFSGHGELRASTVAPAGGCELEFVDVQPGSYELVIYGGLNPSQAYRTQVSTGAGRVVLEPVSFQDIPGAVR